MVILTTIWDYFIIKANFQTLFMMLVITIGIFIGLKIISHLEKKDRYKTIKDPTDEEELCTDVI